MFAIDVEKVKNGPGAVLPLQAEAVLNPEAYGFDFQLRGPLRLTGEIRNLGGEAFLLRIQGKLEAELELVCDRCALPFSANYAVDFTALYSPVLERLDEKGEEDIHLFSGDRIDIASEALQELFLALPTKTLCQPDCKGLCPVCGINRNTDDCSCQAEAIDPRLEKLKDFMIEGSKKGV